MSTPKKNYCEEALAVAKTIEDSEYDEDPNIAADIVVVRNICEGVNSGVIGGGATATPEGDVMNVTPTVTP